MACAAMCEFASRYLVLGKCTCQKHFMNVRGISVLWQNKLNNDKNWHTRCVGWWNDFNLESNLDNQYWLKTLICLRYAKDMLRYAWDMPKICPRYAQDMPEICPRYARDRPKICPRYSQDMPNVCPRYVQDMPKICPRYVQDMPKICRKYAKIMPKKWPRYAQDIVKSPKQKNMSKSCPR